VQEKYRDVELVFLYSPIIKVKHSITETREANNTKAVCTDIPIHILAFVLYKGQCVPTEQTRKNKMTSSLHYRSTMGNGLQQVAVAATQIEFGPPEKHGK